MRSTQFVILISAIVGSLNPAWAEASSISWAAWHFALIVMALAEGVVWLFIEAQQRRGQKEIA